MKPRTVRRPVTAWQAAAFGLVLFLATGLLVVPLAPEGESIRPGDRAAQTYTARHDAQYVSEVLTEQVRANAAARVEPVYLPPDPAIGQQQQERLQALLNGLRQLRQRATTTGQQLAEAANLPGADLVSQSALATIISFDAVTFDDFVRRAERGLADILKLSVPAEQLGTRVDAYLEGANRPDQASEYVALREVLRGFVAANTRIDDEATARAREEARNRQDEVVVTLSAGQVIAQKDDTLAADDIEALRRTGVLGDEVDLYKAAGGLIAAGGLALLLAVGVLQLQPFTAPARRKLALAGLAVVVALAVARGIMPEVMPDSEQRLLVFGLPLAGAAMVTAVLGGFAFGALAAIGVGLMTAFIGATFPDLAGTSYVNSLESLEVAMVTTFAGLAGAAAVSRSHTPLRYGLALIVVTGTVAAALGAFWLIDEPRENDRLRWIGLAAGLHGVAATAGTATVIGIVRRRVGLGLRGDLNRLLQPTHPLLRRLQDEAPGTYHHSMMVASLAEAAARRIGADALLARAGATFHDIGKLARPAFFIENMLDADGSPHDHLSPEESARVIRSHVADGVSLGRQYGLPEPVLAFIPEHHGTRLVTYFYRLAAEERRVSDLAPFRYAGPRPQSRETAIVMLADSCEATVRANQARGPAAIDQIVEEAIAERVAEGQLDECELSMPDLRTVAISFKESLRAVYHPRIPYPEIQPEELARIASG